MSRWTRPTVQPARRSSACYAASPTITPRDSPGASRPSGRTARALAAPAQLLVGIPGPCRRGRGTADRCGGTHGGAHAVHLSVALRPIPSSAPRATRPLEVVGGAAFLRRRAGRAEQARTTRATTPVARQPEHRDVAVAAGHRADANGLAGLMAICIQRQCPGDAIEHRLHVVEVAHAHPAAGQRRSHVAHRPMAAVMAASSSRTETECHRSAARCPSAAPRAPERFESRTGLA